jgi:hypothetical protein
MEQDELFHDDWRDSLRHLVKALGGYDTVGIELWPTKTRKAAGAWLSDCLNPERPAKLDLEEISALLRLGRDRGIHVGMFVLADEIGYSRPATVEPQDAEAEVARQMDRVMHQATGLMQRYERLRQSDAVRHVAEVRGLRRHGP